MFFAWWTNLMRIIMNLCMNGYFHCCIFFLKNKNKKRKQESFNLNHPLNTPGVALMP